MIGCGAIGCELLKNFAMISLGTGGEQKNIQNLKNEKVQKKQ